MPRMFDMLRGKDDDDNRQKKREVRQRDQGESEQKKKVPGSQPLNFPKAIIKNAYKQRSKQLNQPLMSKKIISAVKKGGVDNPEAAKEIYNFALETIKTLLAKIRNNEDLNPFIPELYSLLDKVFNQLLLGDSLLNHIYEDQKEEYFLPYHIVNMLILGLFLGINMGFNKSGLKNLGLACIFCDVGMDSMREMLGQPRKLTDEEYNMMKGHLSKSLAVIEKVETINDIIKETIAMHHERANGSGYPHGLTSDDINPYAKIIGLIDTYEAMTHNRPYRERMNAHKTIKVLINNLKSNYDHDAIKLLIDKMSIYPIGSIVRLDTDEVARVISVRQGSPLRPVVMILKDAFGQNVKEGTIIDLSKPDTPSIQSPI